MKKQTLRIITIIATVVMVISLLTLNSFALNISDVKPDSSVSSESMSTMGGKVLGFIQIVGSIISVGILMILGIKYMMGSAEEKAEYKKTFIPYIVGAILLFSATTIASAVYNAVKQ